MPTKKSSKTVLQHSRSHSDETPCKKENEWCSFHCLCRFFSPSKNIVYNGCVLIVINTFLIFIFGILSFALFIFFPLILILMETLSVMIWYHFGAEIYKKDKEHHIINALFSVLIGLAPLFFLTLVYGTMNFGTGVSLSFSFAGILIVMVTMLAMILMPIAVVIGSIADFIFHE